MSEMAEMFDFDRPSEKEENSFILIRVLTGGYLQVDICRWINAQTLSSFTI